MKTKKRTSTFTLLELLIVVAMIGILVSILIPSLRKARYKVKLVVCANKFNQWGPVLHGYAKDNGKFWEADSWQQGGYINRGKDIRGKVEPYCSDLDFLFNDVLAPEQRNFSKDYTGADHMNGNCASAPITIWAGVSIKRLTDTWNDGSTCIAGDYNQNLTGLGAHRTRNGMPNEVLRENGYWAKSFWKTPGGTPIKTSEVDHNYLFMDGSVKTYHGITWQGRSDITFNPEIFYSHFRPNDR